MAEYGKAKFVTNMLIMTGTMLVIRVMSMAFNIYFTSVIGASGAGICSVFSEGVEAGGVSPANKITPRSTARHKKTARAPTL